MLRPIPICPKCGSMASEQRTKYGIRNECCGLWSWDRFPLADMMTHVARQKAHKHFDQIWKQGHRTRSEAYLFLCNVLGLTQSECHIKLFNVEQCNKVIKLSSEFLELAASDDEGE